MTGAAGYGGDSGPASAAELNNPRGIALALEATGTSIYIADLRNHVVRKIDGDGVITTVAGTGLGANSPDGGLATETTINNPFGVAVDSAGNLFIGEGGVGNTFSHRVRRVDAITKLVTTVVGTGVAGSSPDGTMATLAQINSPRDIAVDASGSLYFVDNVNHRIRVVNSASGTVATVAGTGAGGFSGDDGLATAAQLFGPFFIALDVAGHVYVGDRGNSRARKIDRTTGIITTVAGGFVPPGDGDAATSAHVLAPAGIAFDTSGNLYLADNFTNRVRRVDAATGIITTIVGTGGTGLSADGIPAVTATLNAPQGIAVDSSANVYIADFSLPRVCNSSNGSASITTVAGTGVVGSAGDGGQAKQAQLGAFRGIGLDAAGNLWIADTSNHRVRFVNLSPATFRRRPGGRSRGDCHRGGYRGSGFRRRRWTCRRGADHGAYRPRLHRLRAVYH